MSDRSESEQGRNFITTELRKIPDQERLVPDYFQLDTETAIVRASQTEYPGYPTLEQRLRMTQEEIRAWVDSGMPTEVIQNGAYYLLDHPNRHIGIKRGLVREDDGQQSFQPGTFKDTYDARGNRVDARGIPVHPYAEIMLEHGTTTGPGFYWDYGPNRTADPVVVRQHEGKLQLLVIKRADTGQIALPGGMQDKDEPDFSTALRELQEETGANLEDAPRQDVYSGVVADQRTTLNAWPETTVVLIMPDSATTLLLDLKAGDDASEVGWTDMSTETLDNLFASHGDFVKLAVLEWQKKQGLVVSNIGEIGLASKDNIES